MLSQRSFTLSDFTNSTIIGCGSYSEVYSAIHLSTGCRVAVKIFNSNPNEVPILSEMQIHKDLNHPHIPQYLGRFNLGDLQGIVMEIVDGPRLLDHVIDHGSLSESESCDLFGQLVNAVSYLHLTKSVIHRDLKLENILLTREGIVKLIDFGFACHFDRNRTEKWSSDRYAAPEIWSGEPYNQAIDIWSLGVILYAMVYGDFPNLNSVSEMPESVSSELRDLLGKMLNRDRNERIDISGIIEHPWMKLTTKQPKIVSSVRKRKGMRGIREDVGNGRNRRVSG
jgi:protein-serine/threonine kinase